MPISKYYKSKPTGDAGVSIDGLDALQKAMQKMIEDFPKEKHKLMNQVGDVLVRKIKRRTPINHDPPPGYEKKHEPGRLRRSIHKKVTTHYAVVKSNERYAHLIEAGHVIANEKESTGTVIKRGKNKGQYKMKAKALGFVEGRWMFKRGVEESDGDIKRLIDDFVKRVTDK